MTAFLSRYWKIIVGLVALFLGGQGIGYVLGSLSKRGDGPQPVPTVEASTWEERTLEGLTQSLGLSEEQQAAISPEVAATSLEIQRTRERALLDFHLRLMKLHDAIEGKLDAEQRVKLAKSRDLLKTLIETRFSPLLDEDGKPPAPETP